MEMQSNSGAGSRGRVTALLYRWSEGDRRAADELMPLVYDELKRTASAYLNGERENHTLDTCALVHEAYLRLVDLDQIRWQDRKHFYVLAAQTMRRILVDHARRCRTEKHGGNIHRVDLEEAFQIPKGEMQADLVELDDALSQFAELDPDSSQVLELRFFGGLSYEEIAELQQTSPTTAYRRWRAARAWLLDHMMSNPTG